MTDQPPGDPKDDSSSRFYRAPDGGGHKATGRLVGSVVDPSVEDDGLGLTGPGAPGAFAGRGGDHPVRARLLERARLARGDSDGEDPPSSVPSTTSRPEADWIGQHEQQLKAQRIDSTPTAPATSPSPETPDSGTPTPDRASNHTPLPPSTSEPTPLTPPPAAVASELERIARKPLPTAPGPRLSPNVTAALGGLLGLTVIGSLGLYLSKAEGQRAEPVAQPAPSDIPEKEKTPPTPKKTVREKIEGPWRVADDQSKPGHRILKGKIGKKAFLTAIQDAGLPKGEAYRAYNALKTERNLDRCKSTDSFLALVQGGEKSLVGFEYIVTKEEVYQAKKDEKGNFVGTKLDLKVTRNQIRRSFTHDGNSFEQSARRSGFEKGIAKIAEVSLRGHSMLSDFKSGDQLRIVAQEVTVLGEFSRYAGIEAMEILRSGQEPRRIYYYPHPVEGGHFDKNGRAPYEGGWRKPIPDARRTSPFNPKRMHPVLKRVMPHNGTDYGCSTGTPLGATAPGTISFMGMAGRSGNLVKIKHSGGYESGYAHMSKYVPGMKIGDKVERMQTVGYCGTTGSSTAPHLHFSMKKDGAFIDPESLNLDGLRVLPKSHREEFAEIRSKYDPVLDEIPAPEPLASPPTPTPVENSPEVPAQPLTPEALEKKPAPTQDAATPAPTASKPDDGEPAKAVAPSAIFLTDAELLRMQTASDDGEVKE